MAVNCLLQPLHAYSSSVKKDFRNSRKKSALYPLSVRFEVNGAYSGLNLDPSLAAQSGLHGGARRLSAEKGLQALEESASTGPATTAVPVILWSSLALSLMMMWIYIQTSIRASASELRQCNGACWRSRL